MKKEKFALDTHICAWLDDPKARHRLSRQALKAIDTADALIIPGIVVLELQMLEDRQRIRSARDVLQTLEELGGQYSKAPVNELGALAAAITWSNDPFDRMICADAQYHRATLISADETIRDHFSTVLW